MVAARLLLDELSANEQVRFLVLHDFDKAGFSILGSLIRSTERYRYRHKISVIDLGLRLPDIEALGLEEAAEAVFDRGSEFKRRANMIANGATQAEAEFLLERRVELNAIPSDVLVKWIEAKLKKHGVKKVVP